jgi:hypothetical protein
MLLRVVVSRLLTVRYLTALLLKDTAGGTAGSFMTALSYGTIACTTFTSHHFVVVQAQIFAVFKIFLNGLITNDKFCMSRTARLKLSHWRLPRSARQPSSQGVQSPVEEHVREYLPQQETYEKTTMERSSQLSGTA